MQLGKFSSVGRVYIASYMPFEMFNQCILILLF